PSSCPLPKCTAVVRPNRPSRCASLRPAPRRGAGMIIGVVNANREATIRLVIRGANGQEHEIEAVIDTGFTGFLTLPATLIASLGLAWYGREPAFLGDRSAR